MTVVTGVYKKRILNRVDRRASLGVAATGALGDWLERRIASRKRTTVLITFYVAIHNIPKNSISVASQSRP